MKPIRPNDMMLQVTIRIVAIIIFAFSFYLLLAGHNSPGGGFIGGLMTASAILVLYLAFDVKSISKALPINFEMVIGLGLLLALGTGIVSMILGFPFLTQFFDYFQFPVYGEVELTTALPFDIGIYMVVVGAVMAIILRIEEDDI
ncbi:Na(+)/H(+) antiporter subunit B [Salinicoccus albus]|uniref:Na(+)/H(+) antiporter subunit B n=1 Tax=Salinicoccus albus TaxID=418756 RepID=UPI000371B7F3|nr:Na(+)/H(+) antiporter subunit B [Salinicoccus albus]